MHPEPRRRRVRRNIEHHHARPVILDAKFLGDGRRKIGHLGADQRMTPCELVRVPRRILDGGDELHRRRYRLTSADDAELGRAAKPLGGKPVLESFRVLHRLAIDAHHDVAGFQPGLGSGALGVQTLISAPPGRSRPSDSARSE